MIMRLRGRMFTESIIVMRSLALRELMSDTEEGGRKGRREGASANLR